MKKQTDVVLPYLAESSNGTFYVEYRCFYPFSNRLERFRIYKGFAKCRSQEELQKVAASVIEKYTALLKDGWRPWKDDSIIYQDETEYHNIASVSGKVKRDRNHIRRHFSAFLEFKKNDVSVRTYETYQSKIRRFQLWMEKNGYGELLISQINNDIIIKYFNYLIQSKKLDSITIKNYRMLIGAMFTYFIDKKLAKSNPVHHIPKATKLVDNAARPLTRKDVAKYLQHTAEHDKQLFLASIFSLFLLTRPAKELRLMKVQDIDLRRHIVYVPDDHAKMRKRVVTLSNYLVDIIEEFKLMSYPADYYIFGKEGEPGPETVGKNYFNRKFRKIRDELNLSKMYKFYSLKHTGAGELMESGATLAELMNQLGHTSFESTIHYVRRHFGEKSQKVLNLKPDFLNGINQ